MLSSHLSTSRTSKPYTEATEHPFLRSIADGSAPLDLLALWLSQYRIYAAHAYPRFIAHLITHIPFSASDTITSPRERANQHLLRTLSFCIQNVVDEAQFFLRTAEKYGLDLDCWAERKETTAYVETMLRVASEGSLEEGLIFLWAMEKVYLDAWTSVGRVIHENADTGVNDRSSGVQVLASEFVQNWTNPDFHKFVQELADLVDNLNVSPGTQLWKKAEEIWDTVVSLEVGFWPRIDEDQADLAKKGQ